MLREHHQKLQEQSPIAEFTYMAANTGTRPATSALVTIEALGNFLVQPARPDEVGSSGDNEQEEQSEDGNGSELPRPPIAPSGQWRSMIGDHPHETARALDLFARSFRGLPELIRNQQSIFDYPGVGPSLYRSTPHDPNAFYYKPNRSTVPEDCISLECSR